MTITALQYAELKDRNTIVPLLTQWGGDYALSPLHAAAASGNLNLLSSILRSGEDPDTLGEGVSGAKKRY